MHALSSTLVSRFDSSEIDHVSKSVHNTIHTEGPPDSEAQLHPFNSTFQRKLDPGTYPPRVCHNDPCLCMKRSQWIFPRAWRSRLQSDHDHSTLYTFAADFLKRTRIPLGLDQKRLANFTHATAAGQCKRAQNSWSFPNCFPKQQRHFSQSSLRFLPQTTPPITIWLVRICMEYFLILLSQILECRDAAAELWNYMYSTQDLRPRSLFLTIVRIALRRQSELSLLPCFIKDSTIPYFSLTIQGPTLGLSNHYKWKKSLASDVLGRHTLEYDYSSTIHISQLNLAFCTFCNWEIFP
ncbi:hypothetical protein Hypma_001538 [Hypsizygus marmoreus]|uniref:Uncharacterized protein n=1 Tax=Hypsizygus marmoreus TaxID=39966 RepID=A0A369K8Q8_HYPMA|nr:hypothetical protein Hypma_001538 [Hypsizygus marmoreus]